MGRPRSAAPTIIQAGPHTWTIVGAALRGRPMGNLWLKRDARNTKFPLLFAIVNSSPRETSIGRMLTLDAMRGGAALAVVTYHALGTAPQTAFRGWEAWLPEITRHVVHFAFAGIYLFFVISGFCIHLFWAKARATGVHEPTINFFVFWKR